MAIEFKISSKALLFSKSFVISSINELSSWILFSMVFNTF